MTILFGVIFTDPCDLFQNILSHSLTQTKNKGTAIIICSFPVTSDFENHPQVSVRQVSNPNFFIWVIESPDVPQRVTDKHHFYRSPRLYDSRRTPRDFTHFDFIFPTLTTDTLLHVLPPCFLPQRYRELWHLLLRCHPEQILLGIIPQEVRTCMNNLGIFCSILSTVIRQASLPLLKKVYHTRLSFYTEIKSGKITEDN